MLKIGVMGYGHYGKLCRRVIRRFCDEHDIDVDVLVYEKSAVPDGRIFFRLEELRDCHAVIFAVDMESFETSVRNLLAVDGLREDLVLVNVCSEQARSGAVLAALAPGYRRISFHTPWGPEAFRSVNEVVSMLPATVITENCIGDQGSDALLGFARTCGFKLTTMDAEEHDRRVAARWMFVAHLICRLLDKIGVLDDDYSAAPLSVQKIIEGALMLRNDKKLFFDLWNRVRACGSMFVAFITAAHELEAEKESHVTGK